MVIKYNLNQAIEANEQRHPQEVMQGLGFTVCHYEGHPVFDCVVMEVLGDPEKLPVYVEQVDRSILSI